MPITAISVGTGYGGAGPATPAYPSPIVAGDKLFAIVAGKPNTEGVTTAPTMPGSGVWNLVASNTNKGGYVGAPVVDQGNLSGWVYRRSTDAAGSESGTISITAGFTGAWCALIMRVSSDRQLDTIDVATAEDVTNGNLSLAFGSDPGFQVGDVGVIIFAMTIDTVTFTSWAMTASGITFGTPAVVGTQTTNAAFDMGLNVLSVAVSSGTSAGAPTITATTGGVGNAARGPAILLRLREVSAAGQLVEVTARAAETIAATSASAGTIAETTARAAETIAATSESTGTIAEATAPVTETIAATSTSTGVIAEATARATETIAATSVSTGTIAEVTAPAVEAIVGESEESQSASLIEVTAPAVEVIGALSHSIGTIAEVTAPAIEVIIASQLYRRAPARRTARAPAHTRTFSTPSHSRNFAAEAHSRRFNA